MVFEGGTRGRFSFFFFIKKDKRNWERRMVIGGTQARVAAVVTATWRGSDSGIIISIKLWIKLYGEPKSRV